jgi:predicted anti-sigma-YlaC factor YlaD
MSHQPFENWIIAGEPLQPDEQLQLKEHVEVCPQCHQLKCNMQAVHIKLATAKQVGPAEGFKQRWQTTLLERREEMHRKQTMQIRRFFLVIGGAAVTSLILLAGMFLAGGGLFKWILNIANQLHQINNLAVEIQDIILLVLHVTPPVLPVALWIIFSISLCALVMLYLVSVWHVTFKGVKAK